MSRSIGGIAALVLTIGFASAQSGGDAAVQLLSTTGNYGNTRNLWSLQGNAPGAARVDIRIPHMMNPGDGTGYDEVLASDTYTYELAFDVDPAVQALPRKLLRFNRVNWRADVSLNGQFIGTHEGGASGFEIDVTGVLRPTGNLLVVVASDYRHLRVANGAYGDTRLSAPCGTEASWNYYRGIYDDVFLVGVNDAHFERDGHFAWGIVRGDATPSPRAVPRIHARTGIVNAGAQAATLRAVYRFSAAGAVVMTLATPWVTVPAGTTHRFETADDWPDPRLWWPHDPFLHDVTVTLEDASFAVLDTRSFRFGFRDFCCRKADFTPYRDAQGAVIGDMWLNGRRFRPRLDSYEIGANPGRSRFLWAPWRDPDGVRDFFQGSLDHNVNTVRLSGGGWPRHVLEMAQEMGILVVAESPLNGANLVGIETQASGAVGYAYNFKDETNLAVSDAFWEETRRVVREWVRENRQCAAVVLYSAANEVRRQVTPKALQDDPYFETNLGSLYGAILAEDPTRDVVFNGETANLHQGQTAHPDDPVNAEKALFAIDAHYMNGAGTRNRTSLPGHEVWPVNFEAFRTGNAVPYALGEYFWTVGNEGEARPHLYGGFSADPLRKSVADMKLAHAQTMGARAWRNWDLLGYYAAKDEAASLDMLREAFKPVTLWCRTWSDACYPGQLVERPYVVMNDSLLDRTLTLSVTGTAANGGVFFTFTKDFPLPAGELAEETVRFPAPGWRTGATFRLDAILSEGGVTHHESRRTCQLVRTAATFPVGHTLYHLASDTVLGSLLNQRVRGTLVPLGSVSEIAGKTGGAFVLRDQAFTNAENNAVKTYLAGGGYVVFLASDPVVATMPKWFTGLSLQIPRNGLQRPYAHSIAFKDPAATGPVAAGILDTDLTSVQALDAPEPYGHLRYWGDDPAVAGDENLVSEKCVNLVENEPRFVPIVRATKGNDVAPAMSNVLLARVAEGQGAVWVCTLELVEKARFAPPAGAILTLLLQNARN